MTLAVNAGSSSQHSSESRESDSRDVTLPQKKAVVKPRSAGGSSVGCGTVTVVQVDASGRRSSSSAGDRDDNDDIDDEIDDDADDVSDSNSDVDTTAACCSQVVHPLHFTLCISLGLLSQVVSVELVDTCCSLGGMLSVDRDPIQLWRP